MPLHMGFDFHFYGEKLKNLKAVSNGFLSFQTENTGCCSGPMLPEAGSPNALIAAYWEDLDPAAPGANVFYKVLRDRPNRWFVVQFQDVPHSRGAAPSTCQFQLFEETTRVEVHYRDATSDGGTHVAGIEDKSGLRGLVYRHGDFGLRGPLGPDASAPSCPFSMQVPTPEESA